jgi:hypothetical protein
MCLGLDLGLLLQQHQVLHLGLLLRSGSQHCGINPCGSERSGIHGTLVVVLLQGCLGELLGLSNAAASSAP